jgi:hypothetical protein
MGSELNHHECWKFLAQIIFGTKSTQNITGNRPNFHEHIEFQKEDGKT